MKKNWTRRDFLNQAAMASLGAVAATRGAAAKPTTDRFADYGVPEGYLSPTGFAAPPLDVVRIGFVGVGLQGGWHIKSFLQIDGVEIKAICDIDAPRAEEVASWVTDAGFAKPDLYTDGEMAWRKLCERDDIDLIFSATPWRWHVPVSVEAMRSGKHAAVEVPAAVTIDGCWQLVETAEETGQHCIMMENCCYGRAEMMVLKMVRAGLFGELLHCEGAYIHDLRSIKLSDKSEGLWRWKQSLSRNGNLYPTHGLGPVAQCLDVNRGDQLDYLVSMSSNARGLTAYAREQLPASDPRSQMNFALGDMNSSLIRTKNGRSILIQHDTTTPRPYTRINLVQGTKGTFRGYPNRVFVDGKNEGHRFEDAAEWQKEWDHPLWTKLEEQSAGANHGGMDFLEDYRLIECLRKGEPLDMDVYDAAAWSVVSELSEISVADRSRPVDFPDFTRGRWRHRTPLGIVGG